LDQAPNRHFDMDQIRSIARHSELIDFFVEDPMKNAWPAEASALANLRGMAALALKADMLSVGNDVCYVPTANGCGRTSG
jgi:hypothetical protein